MRNIKKLKINVKTYYFDNLLTLFEMTKDAEIVSFDLAPISSHDIFYKKNIFILFYLSILRESQIRYIFIILFIYFTRVFGKGVLFGSYRYDFVL